MPREQHLYPMATPVVWFQTLFATRPAATAKHCSPAPTR